MAKDIVSDSYKEWLDLLKSTNNMELIDDPYNVWIEAFHVGRVLERQLCMSTIQNEVQLYADEAQTMSLSGEDLQQLQQNLLKQILKIIETMARPV
jgi:hypothetical protein